MEIFIPNEHISEEEKQELKEVMNEFATAMEGKVGKLKMPPYVLPVRKDTPPHAQHYFPPRCYHEANRKEIDRLVELGVIEPDIDSPWAAPAFVLPKKDGQYGY